MAVFAVYIEKEVNFQGQPRPFGNTYHYQTDTGEPFDDALAINQVADAERTITDDDISFTRGVTWGPTDGPAVDNVMRETVELEGSGDLVGAAPIFREMCALFVWPLPRSVPLNRRRWMRKFLRVGGIPTDIPADVAVGEIPIPADLRQSWLDTYAGPVTDLQTLGNFQLCTEDGVTRTGPAEVRNFFITRQIGS